MGGLPCLKHLTKLLVERQLRSQARARGVGKEALAVGLERHGDEDCRVAQKTGTVQGEEASADRHHLAGVACDVQKRCALGCPERDFIGLDPGFEVAAMALGDAGVEIDRGQARQRRKNRQQTRLSSAPMAAQHPEPLGVNRCAGLEGLTPDVVAHARVEGVEDFFQQHGRMVPSEAGLPTP